MYDWVNVYVLAIRWYKKLNENNFIFKTREASTSLNYPIERQCEVKTDGVTMLHWGLSG